MESIPRFMFKECLTSNGGAMFGTKYHYTLCLFLINFAPVFLAFTSSASEVFSNFCIINCDAKEAKMCYVNSQISEGEKWFFCFAAQTIFRNVGKHSFEPTKGNEVSTSYLILNNSEKVFYVDEMKCTVHHLLFLKIIN